MDLSSLGVFQQLERKMNWDVARQQVISQNIANADTPNYKARDLKPLDFSEVLRKTDSGQGALSLTMVKTSPKHMSAVGLSNTPEVVESTAEIEIDPSGNQVSLERETSKLGEVGMDYQALTNLYRKQVSMLKTALGRGQTA